MNTSSNADADASNTPQQLASADFGIRVEGEALVIPSGCTLPLLCVKTNQPVRESDMILANLTWSPQSNGIWIVIGLPALLFAYFVNRDICAITYGLNRGARIKNVSLIILKLLAIPGFFALGMMFAINTSRFWLVSASMWVSFLLSLASLIALFVGNSPLRVVDHRDGMFWVKGFCKEYLDGLEL